MNRGISIVMCCYNSSRRLRETLCHLSNQNIETGLPIELVLVDNGSSDDTPSIASDLWTEFGNPFKLVIVTENRRGIHNARVSGIKAAAHECIVFCDDDNWFDEGYVMQAFSVLSDSAVGVCGGRGHANFEDLEPSWFARYEAVFGCGPQASREGFLDWRSVGMYSAGMAIRKSAIMKVFDSGYQPQFVARTDNRLSGGEDFELVVLIRALGYKAYYSDRMNFQHYMPSGRMTWDYLKRIVGGSAINTAPAYVYADTLRYLYTNDNRYKVNWFKDIIKAIYGAFFIKITQPRDLQILIIRMAGSLASVIKNAFNYSMYKEQVERIYKLTHKTD